MAGVDLPVRPVRRQVAFTEPLAPPAPRVPFTIDFDCSFYFHNSDDGLLFGLADPGQADGFDTTWTPEWLELFRDAARCAPALADMPIARRLGGPLRGDARPQRPDRRRSGELANFLYATGFSGHGFLPGPRRRRDRRATRPRGASPSSTSRRCAPTASAGAAIRPEAHIV